MGLEIPILRKCCFCVPLRIGLLTWTYIKLVVHLVALVILTFVMMMAFVLKFAEFIPVILLVLIITLIFDTIFHIVFITAGHKKNTKMFKIYYHYGLFRTVHFILFYIIVIYISILHWDEWFGIASILFIAIVDVAVQIYVLILIRSEILKLKGNPKFRFAFLATGTDAQCVMTSRKEEKTNTEEQSDYCKVAGLLAMSYFILVTLIFLTSSPSTVEIVNHTILMLLFVTWITFDIILIVAAHKKNYKLFLIYYYYCVVALVINVILFITYLIIITTHWTTEKVLFHKNRLYGVLEVNYFLTSLFGLISIVVQAYVLLLVRSEVLKLEESHVFRFSSLADDAEPKCTMVTAEQQ